MQRHCWGVEELLGCHCLLSFFAYLGRVWSVHTHCNSGNSCSVANLSWMWGGGREAPSILTPHVVGEAGELN